MDRECSIGFLYGRKLLKLKVIVNPAALAFTQRLAENNPGYPETQPYNVVRIIADKYCNISIIDYNCSEMFIKILTKTYGNKTHYYASLVENKRVNGRVVQFVKANLGPVTEEQIPYLKAAYAKKKPRLVYDDP